MKDSEKIKKNKPGETKQISEELKGVPWRQRDIEAIEVYGEQDTIR